MNSRHVRGFKLGDEVRRKCGRFRTRPPADEEADAVAAAADQLDGLCVQHAGCAVPVDLHQLIAHLTTQKATVSQPWNLFCCFVILFPYLVECICTSQNED